MHTSGAFGKKYLPETMGSGVRVLRRRRRRLAGPAVRQLDELARTRRQRGPTPALYRNNRDGTFTDITRGSGLDVELYGIGATAADFDNDGRDDVYITALGGNRLFQGLGGGRFADVTATAGVGDGGFSTSALWFDYDNDGRLDLFVAHYVDWSIEKDLFCTLDGKSKSYCTPESYKGQSPTLFRNRGNGTFEDVTRRAGLFDTTSKGLGVAMLDFDGDGWMDLFVANDTQPNRLYRNKGNGTFARRRRSAAGVAFSEAGVARAGMGVDAADYDGSGRPSLIIGNFSNEMMALYHNEGNGLFIDEAPTIGDRPRVAADADLRLLLLRLRSRRPSGHLRGQRSRRRRHRARAVARHLRAAAASVPERRAKKFEEVTAASGGADAADGRRAARPTRDYDNDGDLDLAGDRQQRRRAALPQRRRQRATTCCACRRSARRRIATASARASRSRSRGGAQTRGRS